jgi:hypothetical protein
MCSDMHPIKLTWLNYVYIHCSGYLNIGAHGNLW